MSTHPRTPQTVNLSTMIERFNVFFRLFAWLFFRKVRLSDAGRKALIDASEHGQIVYVLPSRSRLEYAYHNDRFLREGLPLSHFVPGISMLAHQTFANHVKYLWNRLRGRWGKPSDPVEQFRRIVAKGRPVTLYVREPDTILQWGERGGHLAPYLQALIEHHARSGRAITFVPLMLVWKMGLQRPGRRSLADRIFGDPQAPGALRQMIGFLMNRRRVHSQVLDPLRLGDALNAPEIHDLTPEQQADHLRLLLRNHVVIGQQAIHGPPLKSARTIISEMLRNEEMRGAVEAKGFAWSTGTERRVRHYLKEIAADFRFRVLEFLSLCISFLTERIYKGVEIDGNDFERVRQAARHGPLVLVPCHRSHFDYLAISNLFYNFGLIPPHICAGNNLSFWPLGPLFRGSGAFFIRRRFKGNVLYQIALERYIWKLLREGYWIEFFIEGGRSRTGKMLPPKFGILNTITQAHVQGTVPEIVFLPIFVGYEKILEDDAMAREQTGAKKEKESFGGLVRSARLLQAKYGRLYMRVGEPLRLSQEIEAEGTSATLLAEDSAAFRHFSLHLAHRLEDRINQAAIVTPAALAASALFTTEGRGFSEESLLVRVGLLVDLYLRKQARLSLTLSSFTEARQTAVQSELSALGLGLGQPSVLVHEQARAYLLALGRSVQEPVSEALSLFNRHKLLRLADFEGELAIEIVEERRLKLDMYRNTAIHVLLDEALVALVLVRCGAHAEQPMPRATLLDEVLFLSRLFKREFVYPTDNGFEANLDRAITFCTGWGMVQSDQAGALFVPEAAREPAAWLAANLDAVIEAYAFALSQAPSALRQGGGREGAVRELLKTSRRARLEGTIRRAEAISSVAFANALDWLDDAGYLEGLDKHPVVEDSLFGDLAAVRERLDKVRP